MDRELESRVREIEELITNGQFSEVDNVWAEVAPNVNGDAVPFIELAGRMAGAGQGPKAASLLEMLVDPMVSHGSHEAACDVVVRAAEIDPESKGLEQSARKAFGARFSGIEGFETVVQNAFDRFSLQPGAFVAALREQCSYKPGDFLFHEAGWGLGRVTTLDLINGKLTVDFPGDEAHEVELNQATLFFRRLPATHLLSRKFADMEGLKAEARDNPGALLRCVMKSLEGKIVLRRIKDALSPDVVGKNEWSKWWAGVKAELSKRGALRVGPGANPVVELLNIPSTYEDEFADKLAACHTPVEFARMLMKYLDETKEGEEGRAAFLKKQLQYLFDMVSRRDPVTDGEKILGKFLLDDSLDREPGLDLEYNLEVAEMCKDKDRVLAAIEQLQMPEYEKRVLKLISEVHPQWQAVFAEALFRNIPEAWDLIADELRKAGEDALLNAAARKVHEHAYRPDANRQTWPLQFMWLAGRVISDGTPEEFALRATKYNILSDLLRLGMAIFHRIDKGEKAAKKMMLRLRAVLAERDSRMIRVVLAECSAHQARALLDGIQNNRALSEARVDSLINIFLAKFPEIARKEKAVEVDVEEEGLILTTETGIAKTRRQLDNIMNDELPKIQKAVGEALALGDISENAELDAARAREEVLKAQAKSLDSDLKRAKVMTKDMITLETAGFGTTVRVRNASTKEEREYTILGRWDADASRGVISDISAIGRAIAGLKVGESKQFVTPDGNKLTYEIVSVRLAPGL